MRLWLGFLGALICSAAYAEEWGIQISDDLFSGNAVATMQIGYSDGRLLQISCQDDQQTIVRWIYQGEAYSSIEGSAAVIAFKIDDHAAHQLFASAYQHNDSYVGYKTVSNPAGIRSLLKDMATMKSKITIGASVEKFNFKESHSYAAKNTSSTAKKYMEACGIN